MYYLFRFHHMLPEQVYWLPVGERIILAAFMNQEIEDINKERKTEGV